MIRFGAAIAVALTLAFPARAQMPLASRLSMEKLGDIESGAYQAGDDVKFTLDSDNGNFLLRFEGDPEVFVLYTDRASMGGRVLKYDSGETALQVAGWGGMTLYTDRDTGGLPAVRTGDSVPPAPPEISLQDMQNAASDEAEHLAYMRGLHLDFTADWNALANDDGLRALCFDAMENTARGIERFTASAAGRQTLAHRVNTVLIARGAKPMVGLKDKTLTATFNPARGYAGRASSRAIARALERVFRQKN
ncbi:MAG TPA: DUF4908 domain-containing protein [Rhizomicrobium sp.]|nr:DUF4908 domain-containing protein [Rhizomicrobium sp.]